MTKVIKMEKHESQQEENLPVQAVQAQVNATTSEPPSSGLRKTPVDLSYLKPEQQRLLEEMLYAESAAFAHDSIDIRCIPSLQMSIKLQDDIPVQKSYASVPKPLYKEVKEYIQELLVKGWIVKSKSTPCCTNCLCEKEKWIIALLH